MRNKSANADVAIAQIARQQHGVISTRQLVAAGLTRATITRRMQVGRLHRIHHGVYAVGHSGLSPEGRWMAAVLAASAPRPSPPNGGDEPAPRQEPTAVLSHRSAAELWGLLPMRSGPIDVTVAGTGGRGRRHGIRLHRSRTLTTEDMTRRTRIPVTTPARTLADLRQLAPERELRRAMRQAAALGLALGSDATHDGTRSDLERRFLRLCREHRLPTPEVNARLGSLEVDFLWRDRRLVVETDGYRYHRGRIAFEDDRDRDLRLRALGYETLRLTHRQLTERPGQVAKTIATLLATPPRC